MLLSFVCPGFLLSVGLTPRYRRHISRAHEYASYVIIGASWVQPTGEGDEKAECQLNFVYVFKGKTSNLSCVLFYECKLR